MRRATKQADALASEGGTSVRSAVGVASKSTATSYLSEGMVELDVYVTSSDSCERDWLANVRVTDEARRAGFYVLEDARGVPVRNGKAWVVLINGAKSASGFRALAKGTPLVCMREHTDDPEGAVDRDVKSDQHRCLNAKSKENGATKNSDIPFTQEPPAILPTPDNHVDPELHADFLETVGLKRDLYDYLTDHQFHTLQQLVLLNRDRFTLDHSRVAGSSKIPPHVIQLKPDASPCHHNLRRYSKADREEIDRQIQVLLKAGAIQPSISPWASRVTLVRKKNGKSRMVIDYRDLNAVTVADRYTLPRVDDCLDAVLAGGNKWWTTLDATAGFHAIALHEATQHLTTMITPSGNFS